MNRRRTPKQVHPLYRTTQWRVLRKLILARDGFRCVVCQVYVGRTGAARVDHIQRVSDAPQRALDPSNLRTLCTTCDAQGHRERGSSPSKTRIEQFNHGFDDLGNPRDPKHVWNKAGEESFL